MLLIFRPLGTMLLSATLGLALTACGGSEPSGPEVPAGFTVGYGVKTYSFGWNASANATRYELFEDPDGAAGPQPEVQIGGTIGSTSYAHSVASQLLHERVNASYRVRACDASGCGAWTAALVPDLTKAIGYFKASNSGETDGYGASVALSADGSTLAVGAPGEASKATGVEGAQADNSVPGAGAVYVFTRSASGWRQQAYLKASNTRTIPIPAPYPASMGRALFGTSVSLSADGNTLAVGAPGEASNARGINGDQNNTQAPGAGAVYVFQRTGDTAWAQQAYVKADNTVAATTYRLDVQGYYYLNSAHFGSGVSLSADGRQLAVIAPRASEEALSAGSPTVFARAAYVFSLQDAAWRQQAYVSTPHASGFGSAWNVDSSIAMAADGRTVALRSWPDEDLLVLANDGGTWKQQARLPLPGVRMRGFVVPSTALAADGNTLAVSTADSALVFVRNQGAWTEQAALRPSARRDEYLTLALSSDGNTLAVSTWADASGATGIQGDRADTSAPDAGAVHLYQRSAAAWTQRAYLKASNTNQGDRFGRSVALSGDGRTLAVGATGEDSKATSIQGDQSDNSSADITPGMEPYSSYGAVYLY
ncbi:MAG: hypothetical protein ABS37_07235 [Acidovorax sp. SCN 65-108]|nr:MAG: hypothetical protein ABS37_07235 [Acidovorax sp. SCN 65-108]OJV65076.1 MAG: hypothetical protein BGO35_01785 [Burkholderiales bacterium 64-34]